MRLQAGGKWKGNRNGTSSSRNSKKLAQVAFLYLAKMFTKVGDIDVEICANAAGMKSADSM